MKSYQRLHSFQGPLLAANRAADNPVGIHLPIGTGRSYRSFGCSHTAVATDHYSCTGRIIGRPATDKFRIG